LDFFKFLRDWQIGDLTGLIGLGGLGLTLWQVWQAKSAAQAAKLAAEGARDRVLSIETIVEFSEVVAMFEELRKLHRAPNSELLMDKYSSVRIKLVSLRSGRVELNNQQDTALQAAITTISQLQDLVEKAGAQTPQMNVQKINRLLANDIDNLLETLHTIKRNTAEN